MGQYLKDFNDGSRVICFVETKKGCDSLTRSLANQGYRAKAIHGDKTQQVREAGKRF